MKSAVKKTVFVAMSGGVDSSVAAALLKKSGYEVVGVFIRCFNVDGCASRDAEDARKVAAVLEIPFYIFDFEKEYKKEVVDYMIDGYEKGITPNPDVMCNQKIKFGLFLKKALEMGTDYVATGHYVRIRPTTNNQQLTTKSSKSLVVSRKLLVSLDANKDQSYFLWTLTQDQLKHCLFPIGDYLKSEVRKTARKFRLPTAEKKDSQGICFLGKVALADFLKDYLPEKDGPIFNTEGKVIGRHKGVQFYTIGQRHGLNIPGSKPYYIAEKNAKKNIIVAVEGDNSPALYRKEIDLISVNWISGKTPKLPMSVLARVRYRQVLAPAKLINFKLKTYKLIFDSPQKFVAPGQSAVFYSRKGLAYAASFARGYGRPKKAAAGKEMLGGGIINIISG